MKKKQTTAVFYAYLDPTNREYLTALAKKHKCSMSKIVNTLLIANRKNKDPIFGTGYRQRQRTT